jgi:serine/threonine protein kinase
MDSGQAKLFREELQGKTVGGWTIDGYYGNGKSAVVLPALRGTEQGAIKVFHPELIERFGKEAQLQRIHREASLVGTSHPHLVRILDGGECASTGHLFVVMERIPNRNLYQVLADVPIDAVPKLVGQVASAARFLEDRGMAHRDIKPENIAVSDDFSHATLLDLGVLRPIGLSDLTDVSQRPFIGTLRYSSPEFLMRQEQDTIEGWRAVTFYQLGAVLHDLLMRHQLFHEYGEPFASLVEAVNTVNPIVQGDDARCVNLARRCLMKNPTTRQQLVSWSEFSSLGNALDDSASARRDRIRDKQRVLRSLKENQALSTVDEINVRAELQDACNRLESRIATLMNDLACFPVRHVRSTKDSDRRRCTTCVSFDRDIELGLAHKLSVLLTIEMLDPNNGAPVYCASSSAILSHADVEPLDFPPAAKFFTGELPALLDDVSLEEQFTCALDAAYLADEQGKLPIDGAILPLIEGKA